ncbi:hypothetical protein MMC31_003904 [Peltigera leucophlebia]|nr:hypothetical protein [Peltigera leucophlebia]
MADQLLKKVQNAFEGQIDFEGQKEAETISTCLLAFFGVLAFIIGFIEQNIYITLWVGLAGTAFTFFVVVPPWSPYNTHPETWLPSKAGLRAAVIEVDGKKIN